MDIICATCGCDLTVAKENWNNASVLRPLESVEVLPCSTCLSRAASAADESTWYNTRADVEGERGRGES